MSVFFIFERIMYHKIERGTAYQKIALRAERIKKVLAEQNKTGQRLAAQISESCSATGGEISNRRKS